MSTLNDLLTILTESQAFANLLATYQAEGFPTTAWQVGDIDRTRTMAFAKALADLVSVYVPAIAGGTLLDYAPNYPGWMALLAPNRFGLTQNPATFTTGNILATNTAASGYAFTAGSLKVTFAASGRSYLSSGSGTIPGSGSLSIPVIAENSGAAYVEPSSSANITLTTPLPGVTITNPASTYSSITHTGSGTGTLTLGGSPVGPHQVTVTITSTGQSGVATWSYSLDGAVAVAAGAVSSLTNIGGTGINITLTNGSINPSFVQNDTYTFNAPGSWITSHGADQETDTALATRCRNRWSSLSNVPTQSLYQLLAQSEPTYGPQVTQVFIVADSVINNKVNVVVAGPGGVLPGGAITALQAYLTPRARGCDIPVVQSPTTTAITIVATITVTVSQLATAQAAITTALQSYIANMPVNGTIRISDITQIVMDVDGVVDCTGVTINAVAANLALGSPTTYVLPTYPPTLTLSYVAV